MIGALRFFGSPIVVGAVVLVSLPAAAATPAVRRLAAKSQAAQLQLSTLQPEQVRVESINPALAAPVASASPGGTTIDVKQGDQLVVVKALSASESTSPVALAEKVKARLPATLVVGVADAAQGTIAKQYQPFLSAEVSPLRWDAQAMSYVTTVVVGLDPVGDTDEGPVKLPSAIRFQLTGENVSNIEPPHVEVTEAGAGGYQRFRVLTGKFEQLVRVSAHSRFGDKSYEAAVDPGPASLELLQSEARVDGLGLGKTTIGVRQRAANQQPWPASAPLQIHLKTSRGFLTPSTVPIAAQASSGQTSLVSSGWGDAVVSDSSNADERARTVTVAFSFPWLKFLLGFLGAAVAGALRVFTTEPGKRQGWLPVFLGCLASGLTIDILVALGAPLAPEWLLSMMRSELAWLAVGLVAGYPGVAAVAWLGEKLFAFKKPEPAGAPTS
ncbi:MAG TPA: hypothetical protein VEQ59_11100 [Polyangiaceae bacterium]|nr:hypothetical protein [Polyangiaceae bacterium]